LILRPAGVSRVGMFPNYTLNLRDRLIKETIDNNIFEFVKLFHFIQGISKPDF
jgi:hypothetical protein